MNPRAGVDIEKAKAAFAALGQVDYQDENNLFAAALKYFTDYQHLFLRFKKRRIEQQWEKYVKRQADSGKQLAEVDTIENIRKMFISVLAKVNNNPVITDSLHQDIKKSIDACDKMLDAKNPSSLSFYSLEDAMSSLFGHLEGEEIQSTVYLKQVNGFRFLTQELGNVLGLLREFVKNNQLSKYNQDNIQPLAQHVKSLLKIKDRLDVELDKLSKMADFEDKTIVVDPSLEERILRDQVILLSRNFLDLKNIFDAIVVKSDVLQEMCVNYSYEDFKPEYGKEILQAFTKADEPVVLASALAAYRIGELLGYICRDKGLSEKIPVLAQPEMKEKYEIIGVFLTGVLQPALWALGRNEEFYSQVVEQVDAEIPPYVDYCRNTRADKEPPDFKVPSPDTSKKARSSPAIGSPVSWFGNKRDEERYELVDPNKGSPKSRK